MLFFQVKQILLLVFVSVNILNKTNPPNYTLIKPIDLCQTLMMSSFGLSIIPHEKVHLRGQLITFRMITHTKEPTQK